MWPNVWPKRHHFKHYFYKKADNKVIGKFREVSFTFPDMYVGADIDERLRQIANGPALVLLQQG